MASPLLIAKSGATELHLLPALANRHGLITGATGTGKTVTLQALAQQLSGIGVSVFMADVKGDLSGLARPGGANAKVLERAKLLGIDLRYEPCPVVFWDVFGESGHPVRATVSDMRPLLLARLLGLNDTQEGVLNLVFKIADDGGLHDGLMQSFAKSAVRTIGSQVGREIIRGVLGSIFGGGRRR